MAVTPPSVRCLIALLLVLLTASCEQPEQVEAPYQFTGDIKHTMSVLLEPAAEVIWDSAGTIETLEGVEDLQPTTEEGWAQVQYAATVVAETGNLLMMPGRSRGDDWQEVAQGLVSTGQAALLAAQQQDADALFEAGGQIYNVCVSCHQLYWTEGSSRFTSD